MKKKMLFLLPNLNIGGAEKIISILCNNLNRNNFEIILCLLKKEGVFLNTLSKDIKIIDLKINHVRNSFFKIKKIIETEKPDIVFSTLSHLNLFISIFKVLFPKNIVFIGRESNIVSEFFSSDNLKDKIFKLLYKYFYNNLDYIVCQSQYMANDLINNFKIKKSKIKVINNPLDIKKIKVLSKMKIEELKENKIKLITVGRLDPIKQHCFLIELFSKLDPQKYHLYIIGEGAEKSKIENKIKKLKLQNNITLLGKKENPFSYVSQCDVFLLTSKYEGFPNAMLEALALDIPVLSLKSPGGVLEIIKESENGYFFHKEEFLEKIEKTLKINKDKISNTVEKYDMCHIIKKYEEFFFKI